ncbi:hypothetical protein G6F56_011293 [Rhizopus delemar]|nr:hypothetical protein G6F56_011293 [Rhizopus delemar]
MSESLLYQRIKETTFYNIPKVVTNLYANTQSIVRHIPISRTRLLELQSRIYSWDFSPFDSSDQELIQTVYFVFDQLLSLPELCHLSSLRQDTLYNFITDLSTVYHNDNPYHNFSHAVDVLQCLFFMLCETGVLPFTNKHSDKTRPQGILLPIDAFALLVASIGHDAAHPGVNNMFLLLYTTINLY